MKSNSYLMNLIHTSKTSDEQFHHFVNGSAEVGKSRLIRVIVQTATRYYISMNKGNPDALYKLHCALNIRGMTHGFQSTNKSIKNAQVSITAQ